MYLLELEAVFKLEFTEEAKHGENTRNGGIMLVLNMHVPYLDPPFKTFIQLSHDTSNYSNLYCSFDSLATNWSSFSLQGMLLKSFYNVPYSAYTCALYMNSPNIKFIKISYMCIHVIYQVNNTEGGFICSKNFLLFLNSKKFAQGKYNNYTHLLQINPPRNI